LHHNVFVNYECSSYKVFGFLQFLSESAVEAVGFCAIELRLELFQPYFNRVNRIQPSQDFSNVPEVFHYPIGLKSKGYPDSLGTWLGLARTVYIRRIFVGLARTVYIHRICPYIWWYPCQKYRIYTVYIWFWPTLRIFEHFPAINTVNMVLASPTHMVFSTSWSSYWWFSLC